MPRRSAAEASQTRDAIVARAVELASTHGLEGVTIGRLAEDLELSKAGVLNHFKSKELLQLAAVQAARDRFVGDVWRRASELPPGLGRLVGLCDAWIAHIAGDLYPGGCFWSAASFEFDGRPGLVRNAIAEMQLQWSEALTEEVRTAIALGEIPRDADVAQVVFELRAVALGLNQSLQLHGDADAVRRARRAMRRALGRPDLPLRGRRLSRAAA